MHNEDLSLAPHMQRAAITGQQLNGSKTGLIEPMQGSEVQRDRREDGETETGGRWGETNFGMGVG